MLTLLFNIFAKAVAAFPSQYFLSPQNINLYMSRLSKFTLIFLIPCLSSSSISVSFSRFKRVTILSLLCRLRIYSPSKHHWKNLIHFYGFLCQIQYFINFIHNYSKSNIIKLQNNDPRFISLLNRRQPNFFLRSITGIISPLRFITPFI